MNLFHIGGKSILNLSERDLDTLEDGQILGELAGNAAEIKLLDTDNFTVHGLVRLVDLAKSISSQGFTVQIKAAGSLAHFLKTYPLSGSTITFEELAND